MQACHASRGGCAQIWQFMVHVVFYIFDVICCPLRYLKQVKGPAAYQRTVAINTLTCLVQSVQGARCGEGLCEDGTDGLCRGVLWQHCQGRHPEVPLYLCLHSHTSPCTVMLSCFSRSHFSSCTQSVISGGSMCLTCIPQVCQKLQGSPEAAR